MVFILLEQAEVTPWISSKHNMGMAFNRVTWNKLRKCAAQFCSYDDYNWDWSLQYIAQTCVPSSRGAGIAPRAESGLITMTMRAPRVFHIGEWRVSTLRLFPINEKLLLCDILRISSFYYSWALIWWLRNVSIWWHNSIHVVRSLYSLNVKKDRMIFVLICIH